MKQSPAIQGRRVFPRAAAIVTGGAGGIGTAICEALCRHEGLQVLAVDRDPVKLAELAKSAPLHTEVADVGVEPDVRRVVATATKLGEPSVLVNCAGIGGPFQRLDEVSLETYNSVFDTNVRSVFLFARALLPRMREAGYGRILNIASIQGLYGARLSSTYVASKHAMIGYTRAIAAEWGPHGVTCNALCPGYIDTRMGVQPNARAGHSEAVLARTPNGRVGLPSEVASLAVQMVSNRHMNGAVVTLDGGITADVGI